jgi:hypothetical protein
MRKWLARKLFDLAVWLDWETVFIITLDAVMTKEKRAFAPKKIGRPLGAKDKKPRKRPVRKVQP